MKSTSREICLSLTRVIERVKSSPKSSSHHGRFSFFARGRAVVRS
jgi:hypothetical protein